MNKTTAIWILGILALLVIATGVWFVYFKVPSRMTYSTSNTPTAVLTTLNENYATAVAYEKAQKYDLALLSYGKALVGAVDRVQTTQIRLKIALMTEKVGNYKEAIAKFKTIAADTTNYAIARAYAVQEIGLMNVYFAEKNARDTISTETFKDAPYDSFKKEGDLNMTYTKLFEYASSFYPLGYSEARVAFGYAGELLTTLKGATTTPKGIAYISIVTTSLQSATADLQRMKAIPGEAILVPETLVRQGNTVSRLSSVGVLDPKMAESYFKAGVAYDVTLGNKPGSFNAFNYATYLVTQFGTARSGDIKTLLLPFRVGNDVQIYSNIAAFLRSARTDTTLVKNKKQILSMGHMDSDFKTYLISLGWKASDF